MNLPGFYPTRLQMNYGGGTAVPHPKAGFLSVRRSLTKGGFFMLFISEIHPFSQRA
jgi:hypothetical protein